MRASTAYTPHTQSVAPGTNSGVNGVPLVAFHAPCRSATTNALPRVLIHTHVTSTGTGGVTTNRKT